MTWNLLFSLFVFVFPSNVNIRKIYTPLITVFNYLDYFPFITLLL